MRREAGMSTLLSSVVSTLLLAAASAMGTSMIESSFSSLGIRIYSCDG